MAILHVSFVRNDAQAGGFLLSYNVYAPLERIVSALLLGRQATEKLIGLDQFCLRVKPARLFKSDHHVRNEQRVFEKYSCGGMILLGPIPARARNSKSLMQKISAAVSERVSNGAAAAFAKIIDLRTRPVQISVVKESVVKLRNSSMKRKKSRRSARSFARGTPT